MQRQLAGAVGAAALRLRHNRPSVDIERNEAIALYAKRVFDGRRLLTAPDGYPIPVLGAENIAIPIASP